MADQEQSLLLRGFNWLNRALADDDEKRKKREREAGLRDAMRRGERRLAGDQDDGYQHGRRHDTPTKALQRRRGQ